MFKNWVPRILATVVCAASFQSFAAFSTSASVANVQYQLFDLDPDDGIAPSVTFNIMSGTANYQVLAIAYAYVNDQNLMSMEGPAGTALSASAAIPQNSAAASVLPGNIQTFEDGGGAVSSSGNVYAYANVNAFVSYFTLSPNTLLVLSAYSSNVRASSSGEYALGVAEVVLEGVGQLSDSMSKAEIPQGSTGVITQAPLLLTASFSNLSSVAVSGFAAVRAVAYGSAPAAQVPEPAVSAMMTLGFVFVGLWARRLRAVS